MFFFLLSFFELLNDVAQLYNTRCPQQCTRSIGKSSSNSSSSSIREVNVSILHSDRKIEREREREGVFLYIAREYACGIYI